MWPSSIGAKFIRILERLPGEVSRVRGRDWAEATLMMERGRDQALALVPLARRALRIVPPSVAPASMPTASGSPQMAPFVLPDAVRSMSGVGEGPA